MLKVLKSRLKKLPVMLAVASAVVVAPLALAKDKAETAAGLFQACYNITSGLIGATSFRVNFLVNAPAQTVNGNGRITNTSNPPLDVKTVLSGDYFYLTTMSETTIAIRATGYPRIDLPKSGGVGLINPANVYLSLDLTNGWEEGNATYKYVNNSGNWQNAKGNAESVDCNK